jgi:hypothetical protein
MAGFGQQLVGRRGSAGNSAAMVDNGWDLGQIRSETSLGRNYYRRVPRSPAAGEVVE